MTSITRGERYYDEFLKVARTITVISYKIICDIHAVLTRGFNLSPPCKLNPFQFIIPQHLFRLTPEIFSYGYIKAQFPA